MPLNPTGVALAMADGLSAVCASCRLYWEARDRGIPGHKCLSREKCGSPLVGDAFHEYDGPLVGGLHQFCFVCGDKSRFVARVRGRTTGVGICAEHVRLLDTLKADGKELVPNAPKAVVLAPDGTPVSSEAAPKKSLFAAIQEVEDYYASKDRESA